MSEINANDPNENAIALSTSSLTITVNSILVWPGDFMGQDIVFFPNIDTNAGKISVGISRKAGQGGVTGSGVITKIRMKMSAASPMGQQTALTLQNVQANDPEGNAITLTTASSAIVTDARAEQRQNTVTEFMLHPNHPNPFNPETMIEYEIPEPVSVRLEVFDINGKLVATLVDQAQQPGAYRVLWDSRDHTGDVLPSGTYIYRLQAGKNFVATRKMLLIR